MRDGVGFCRLQRVGAIIGQAEAGALSRELEALNRLGRVGVELYVFLGDAQHAHFVVVAPRLHLDDALGIWLALLVRPQFELIRIRGILVAVVIQRSSLNSRHFHLLVPTTLCLLVQKRTGVDFVLFNTKQAGRSGSDPP